jgi:TatD DNase family protein
MASDAPVSMVDTHVHLPAYADPMGVVEGARARGMRLVSVTVSAAEAQANLFLRRDHPTISSFVGVHPSEAQPSKGSVDTLAPFWKDADGIGEIGLDPKYSEVSADSAQMQLFVAQVDLAERLRKPIQVHSRGAEEACLSELEGRSLQSILLHWFEGEESLTRAIALPKSFVSFGPALLYSKKLLRIAKRVPPEAILTESDGPVPFAALGGAEGPGLIPSVAFMLAEIWGKSVDEAVLQLSLNADRYLG